MKKMIPTILLLLSVGVYGQLAPTTTVKLYAQACRDGYKSYYYFADTLLLQKLPEDTQARGITVPFRVGEDLATIEKLPVSEYKLVFKNKFGQKMTKRIALTAQDSNVVRICLDSLSAYPKNTLATLQDADSIRIGFHSMGCFHNSYQMITITKYSDGYVARFYGRDGERKRGGTTQSLWPKLLKTASLNDKNIAEFIRFENELGFMEKRGCTTVGNYTLRSKHLNMKITDGSCNWYGFSYLVGSFFGNVK
jgi:hypothetical protein